MFYDWSVPSNDSAFQVPEQLASRVSTDWSFWKVIPSPALAYQHVSLVMEFYRTDQKLHSIDYSPPGNRYAIDVRNAAFVREPFSRRAWNSCALHIWLGSYTDVHIAPTLVLVGRRLDSPVVDRRRNAVSDLGVRLVFVRVGGLELCR